MDQCSCIIHYDFITTSDQLIKLSQASLKTLTESKETRESLKIIMKNIIIMKKIVKKIIMKNSVTAYQKLWVKDHFFAIGNATKSLLLLKQY